MEAAPDGDRTIDVKYAREVVGALVVAAERDRVRARADHLSVGAELARFAERDRRVVSLDVLTMAVRLRQLDCAVWAGRVGDGERLSRDFDADARALLAKLGGEPPPVTLPPLSEWRLPPPKLPPQAFMTPRKLRDDARDFNIGGGILVASGAAFLAGGLALTIVSARTQIQPCSPQDFICFNDLDEGLRDTGIVVGALLLAAGATATISGATLLYKAHGWTERARLQPTVSVAPNGGFAGVRLQF